MLRILDKIACWPFGGESIAANMLNGMFQAVLFMSALHTIYVLWQHCGVWTCS